MKASFFSASLLRQTWSRLVRERGFTVTVLMTLALCVGANIAMFAVIDAVLMRALPYKDSGELVVMYNSYPGAGADRVGASHPNYYNRREGLESFESVSIWQGGSSTLGGDAAPRRVGRLRVSPEFFETLQVPLALGRTFTDEEMIYENWLVAILSYEFWQNEFAGDSDILGQTMMVDGQPVEIIGLAPKGFRFLDSDAQFYMSCASTQEELQPDRRHSNNVQMIARLADGVSIEAAQDEVDRFNALKLETDPYAKEITAAGFRTHVSGFHADLVKESKTILLLLQAGAVALLAIGCVNLINLLLIRAKGREKEIAVRQSLGAGRGHLAREILYETVMLALVGGLLGLAVGAGGIRLLETLGADQLPLGTRIGFDGRVALAALIGSISVGVALAVPVYFMSAKRNLTSSLQSESRTGTVSRAAQTARHAFIVIQVGLAFVLLAGAGLLGVSLKNALDQSPGFQSEKVLTANIGLPWKRYPEGDDKQAFMGRALSELRAIPGVVSVGMSELLPFSGANNNNATVVEGIELAPGESLRTHHTGFAHGDYFKALGIPLLEGRFLDEADAESERRVCVVDEALAKRYWPDGSALGKRLANDVTLNEENLMTIVGVVGTIKLNDLTDRQPLGSIYMPYRMRTTSYFYLVLRTAMDPEVLSRSLRDTIQSIDPELPVDRIKLMQARIDDSLLIRRSPAMLAGIFAGVALLLAAIGTYGVLGYAVGQRTREIGVRMAIGGAPSRVMRQFLWMGIKLLLVGLVIGVVVIWFGGRAMSSVLFDVVPFHLGVVAGTASLMALVVLVASFLPSWKASQVSPLEAMRGE